ncbi:Histone-lysine N-methyltransferase SETMAR, partial [Stegodyphus mimosarum]
MDTSKTLVRSCLLYDFKVGLSAAELSRQIFQAFGDDGINERTIRQWFQKFSQGICLLVMLHEVVKYTHSLSDINKQ